MPQKVRIVTLGCAKNDVDSEEIAGVLAQSGYTIDGESETTDVTIINTCGFLEAAKKESIESIRDAVRQKESGKTGKVIVAGCLAQRLGADLMRLAPGADAYVGVGQMARFGEIVSDALGKRGQTFDVAPPHHRWADVGTRARSGRPWSAYLKVSEGCDHKCTFCTIPSFRGVHQSKPLERILEEAHELVGNGCREINLIAQDVTQYGYDLYRRFTLPKLLTELNSIDGLDWIRILYFYPNRLTDEVIETMASCEKVAKYIDIPLQHAHPETLRRMRRPWDGDRYLKLFETVRGAMPDVSIRTTFIVGFPGETDEEFEYLQSFVEEARLDRVGAFLFSREKGTPSYEMPDQVSFQVKRRRYARLMSAQQGISLERNRQWIGRTLRVLTEEHRDHWTVARSYRDAPDIDGVVFIEGLLPLGQMKEVQVTSADPYDLYADHMPPAGLKKNSIPLRRAMPLAPR